MQRMKSHNLANNSEKSKVFRTGVIRCIGPLPFSDSLPFHSTPSSDCFSRIHHLGLVLAFFIQFIGSVLSKKAVGRCSE
jgi:hypothetical protein